MQTTESDAINGRAPLFKFAVAQVVREVISSLVFAAKFMLSTVGKAWPTIRTTRRNRRNGESSLGDGENGA